MKEIILSVVFNVGTGILLKMSKSSKHTNSDYLIQVITFNYIFSALFAYLLYKPDLPNLNYAAAPWLVYAAMSILMPVLFILIGKSIQTIGIARTDTAQRLSLLITVLAAFFIFHEEFTSTRLGGLAIGISSIFFIFYTNKSDAAKPNQWVLPIVIFFMAGLVNILYKLIAANTEFNYTTSTFFIFIGSSIVGILINILKKQRFDIKNMLWGLGLAVLNVGNVLYYLKAHQVLKDNPSIVFATMNLGVIILGSAIGIFVFKENMNKVNYFGLCLALLSIFIIIMF